MLRKLLSALLLSAAVAAPVHAQSFPTKPIHILIGYGAGGVTDVLNRTLADEMSRKFGQPVIVENRTGAAGLIAAQAVKGAPPDGYMLIGGSASTWFPVFVQNGLVATKDFAPVATFAGGDWMVYVAASSGVHNMKEFVAYAKSRPNKPRHMSVGGLNHMLLSLIGKRAGIEFEEIRYKTSAETIGAILAGDGDITINALSGFEQFLDSGRLRAITTLSPQRSVIRTDVPTALEQGIDFQLRFYRRLSAS